MLPRRNSTSGSLSGRRPLSVAINQQTFRASTAGTVETESPQSEISPQPQATPSIPPRPPAFSQLPPRISGLRRQSTRRDTHEAYASILEEDVPASSQPVPGSGIGGFAAGTPFHHDPNRNDSQQNTADYTYRFDTIPSSQSDSDSGGVHAKIWPTYNRVSKEFDDRMSARCNSNLDTPLLFAALFSAIVTTFLIRALDDLEPNYEQQSALLLHQILHGRDPSLDNISNPTIPFNPSGLAIAVNCLWFASLSASLGAAFCATICKEWVMEYHRGANPVTGLLRACHRHARYMAFQWWSIDALVALLLPLLYSSVFLFFAGAVVYLWRMDERVAIMSQVIGGIFIIPYFISTIRSHSTLLLYRLSVAIGMAVIPIMDPLAHGCYLTARYVASTILWPIAQLVVGSNSLQRWYMEAPMILPKEYKHIRVWWENSFDDSLDKVDTSQKVQEEAILWLSQMPLDSSESRDVVSSLALISSSRPHSFPKSVVAFLNLTLESSLNEISSTQTDTAVDCVLVLGYIKFQSTVDRNSDRNHNVGGIPVTAFVAWAAQQLTINAFHAEFNTPYSEEIQARLLTSAAWLSPVDGADVEWNGEKLKIQDRFEFIEKIRMMLERHAQNDKPLDNKIFINLIHGMHACIPRGEYGIASSIVSFLPMLCDDYDSPWSEDEAVLRTLITYTLDLLLPSARRKPLVEREIEFGQLASELIDTVMVTATNTDAVVLAFWLIYRIPYAFKSRKTLLADIAHIWTLTNAAIPEDRRERMNFYAVDAFVAVTQFHSATVDKLPKFTPHTTLGLLKAGLEYDYSRAMATYAIAMILNLGTSSQAATFTSGITAELFGETLFNVKSDLEKNATDEDVVDLRIYSTLILLKFRTVDLDTGKVKALIGEMIKATGDSIPSDSGVARNSGAESDLDLDRVRWKAIYLSALLFKFVPEDEKQGLTEGFRAKVLGLLRSGGLPLVNDYKHCIEPLGMDGLDLSTPAEKRGPAYAAFEVWIDDFPFLPLAGSVASA